MLWAEREAPGLTALDPAAIARARRELESIGQEIRVGYDAELYRQYDAIADHLGTICTFRLKKMMAMVGNPTPDNILDEERQFYASLESMVSSVRAAWGLPE
jgi:DNA replication initiation complex subunit (GINS family)